MKRTFLEYVWSPLIRQAALLASQHMVTDLVLVMYPHFHMILLISLLSVTYHIYSGIVESFQGMCNRELVLPMCYVNWDWKVKFVEKWFDLFVKLHLCILYTLENVELKQEIYALLSLTFLSSGIKESLNLKIKIYKNIVSCSAWL